MSDSGVIGVARPRIDAPEKVTGATRFGADGIVHGLLHARLVLSPEPHARIRSVDREQALAMPGVVAVLTADDLPIRTTGNDRAAEPLAREEVVFAGQPVAIVVAQTEAEAEDAAEMVVVEYEPLEAVVDVEQAMQPGAALARLADEEETGGDLESIHTGVDESQETDEEEHSGNVLNTMRRSDGDVAALLEASDAVVSGTFRTPWIYQAYIEPQVATAWVEPNGDLVVSAATQGSFVTRGEVARAYGLPLDRVRVVAEPLGGAFGGKFAIVEPLAAGAALALRRPVRLVLTRTEDFQATNPASAQVTHLTIGGRKDGTLTAIDARMVVDRGSNAGWGVEAITSLLVAGPYRWEAHDLRGYGVQTNRFTFGAYRGPGAPTAAYALETLVDELAAQLGLDPLELRRKNAVVQGDVGVSGSPFPTIGAVEVLERIAEHHLWTGRASLPEDEGVGLALGYWPGGNEPAAAVCRVNSDGTMTIVTSAVDMSGVNTGFAAIAAETFGLAPEQVRVVTADTSNGPVLRSERRLEGDLHRRRRGASRSGGRAGRAPRGGIGGARDRADRPRGRRRRRPRRRRSRPLDHRRGDREADAPLRRPAQAHRGTRRLRPDDGSAGGGGPSRPRPGGSRDGRDRAPRLRGRAGRRSRAEPRARGRAAERWSRAGHGVGALRGAGARRDGPAADGILPRLRAPDRGARP